MDQDIKELSRLRNRHVAKLLTAINPVSEHIEFSVKKQFTLFASDVVDNILNHSEHRGINGDKK